MLKFENKPSKGLMLVKTLGQSKGSYDLYDLRGLSLGKLVLIESALREKNSALANELLLVMGVIDTHQTVNGK